MPGRSLGLSSLEILSEYIRVYGEYHVLLFGLVALAVSRFAPEGIDGDLGQNAEDHREYHSGRERADQIFRGPDGSTGVDFHLMEGEIVGLIGPNGAGKTTLFNLVSGVFPPDTGSLLFKGTDIQG